jgi:hypothetical protein
MNKRILIVDDQEDNRRIIRDMLAAMDCDLTEAENGEQAVNRVPIVGAQFGARAPDQCRQGRKVLAMGGELVDECIGSGSVATLPLDGRGNIGQVAERRSAINEARHL